ncbi:MAG: hypothetical protein R2751_12245 [Bacteroidales bacterium]
MKHIHPLVLVCLSLLSFLPPALQGQHPDWEGGFPDGCTSITAGKAATADGSVITSHTDDSHRTRSWLDVVPAMDHPANSTSPMFKREACDSFAMPTYAHRHIG